jgi:hypothetical protein
MPGGLTSSSSQPLPVKTTQSSISSELIATSEEMHFHRPKWVLSTIAVYAGLEKPLAYGV